MASKISRKRRGSKKTKKQTRRRTVKTQSGGGWKVDVGNMIIPGYAVNQQYPGPGYDCAGLATRPGDIASLAPRLNSGLPGVGTSPASHPMRGGGTQLGSGGPVIVTGVPVSMAETPGKYPGSFQDIKSALPTTTLYRSQSGGRYGFEGTPLSPSNGVGMSSYGPIGRVHCETGSFNAMNPTAPMPAQGTSMGMGVQGLTTAPASLPSQTQYMKGGGKKHKKNGKKNKNCRKTMRRNRRRQSGGVMVGQVDAMRYYAPTAGYTNKTLLPMVPNNPYMDRIGYDARLGLPTDGMNLACLKTA